MATADILKAGAKKYAQIPAYIDKSAYSKVSGVPVSQVSQSSSTFRPSNSRSNSTLSYGSYNPTVSNSPSYTPPVTDYNMPSYSQSSSTIPDYSLSDAELFNTQLENAYLLKQLGYDVDFQGDDMVYSKSGSGDYTPYGAYGYGQESPYYYEEDYYTGLQKSNSQYPRYDYYYGSYYNSYAPSNGYYNRYYSNHGQRYQYSGYRNYRRYNSRRNYYANRYNRRKFSR